MLKLKDINILDTAGQFFGVILRGIQLLKVA